MGCPNLSTNLMMQDKYFEAISEVAIIAFTGVDGNILYANDKFCEISEYSRDELIGSNHRIVNSHFHPKEFFDDMYKTIFAGKIWRGEIKNKSKSGKAYWVDTKIIPIFSEQKKIEGFVSVRFDISERKKLEDVVGHFDRLATIGQMSASIAHEINNPLAIISLATKSIQKEKNHGLGFNNNIDRIQHSVSRISKILKGLKNYSKFESDSSFREVDLFQFLNETISICIQDEIKSVLTIGLIPHQKITIIPEKMSQVLINIINNAYEAIEFENDRWIRINIYVRNEKNRIEIEVINSGEKINSEVIEKIMLPFYTTKKEKGNGLGLSISNEIMREHNGELYVDTKNKYTTFLISFPVNRT